MTTMPQSANALTREPYLRAYIMGAPKVGKSSTVVSTAPKPVYVINCDQVDGLSGAARRTKEFEWDLIKSRDEMQLAIKTAKDGVKAKKYKTIIIDTFSSFAAKLEQWCLDATDTGKGPDGRRAYPDYEKRLRHVVESCFRIEAHVIFLSHYLQIGGEIAENGTPKYGDGIVPLLAGKARATVPMLFSEVIFMTFDRDKNRVFVCNPQGAWGPGSRSLETSDNIPADVGKLIEAIDAQSKTDNARSNGKDGHPRPSSREARR
jgi:hypothetical protein